MRVVWRHKLLILGAAILVTAAALWHAEQQPKSYTASTKIVLLPVVSAAAFNSDSTSTGGPLGLDFSADTQAALIQSSSVASGVIRDLHLRATPEALLKTVGVRQLTTQVLEIDATAGTPRLAARVANGFARNYIKSRQKATDVAISALITDLLARERTLRGSAAKLSSQILDLSVQLASVHDKAGQAQLRAKIDGLTNQRDSVVAQIGALAPRVQDLQASESTPSGPGQIVADAVPPKSPSSPQPVRDGAVGLLLGLLLGLGLAFLRNHLDEKVTTMDQAAAAGGAPVLASVPHMSRRQIKKFGGVPASSSPDSAPSDSYRALRANLAARGLGSTVRRLLVTSVGASEGKTSTVANLAIVCANSGMRTIAVSADVRRPKLAAMFNLPTKGGLAAVLRGQTSLEEALVPTSIPNLSILPSGVPAASPDLLASAEMDKLLVRADELADVIVLDAPPSTVGGDVATLAPRVDGVILVVRANRVRPALVTRVGVAMEQIGSPIIGTVLNAVGQHDDSAGVPTGYQYLYRAPSPSVGDKAKGNGSSTHAQPSIRPSEFDRQ